VDRAAEIAENNPSTSVRALARLPTFVMPPGNWQRQEYYLIRPAQSDDESPPKQRPRAHRLSQVRYFPTRECDSPLHAPRHLLSEGAMFLSCGYLARCGDQLAAIPRPSGPS